MKYSSTDIVVRMTSRLFLFAFAVFLLGVSMMAGPAPAIGAEDLEYSRSAGLNQEEWYDPTDWFNDAGPLTYQNDWIDYTYGSEDEIGSYGYYDGYYDPGLGTGQQYYYTDNWYEENEAGEYDSGLFDF